MIPTKNKILVYGSYGYTGKLIVEELKRLQLPVVLSGRNEEKLKQQQMSSGYQYTVLSLDDTRQLESLLGYCKMVVHCAGPFLHTAELMLTACLKTKTHYTDITGEFQVFDKISSYHDAAIEAGITLMPGIGFDVVPSDCLAGHLQKRLPDASHLQLAFTNLRGGLSRGTARTSIENLGTGSFIRENGKLKNIKAGSRTKEIDFGELKRKATCIPWGDITSAYQSTGIPNIEVYMGVPDKMIRLLKLTNLLSSLLKKQWVKNWLKKKIDQRPEGPSEERRREGRSLLWGRIKNKNGIEKTTLLEVPDGYTLTALTVGIIVSKIFTDNFKPGYQTPSMAYGNDLILEVPTSKRTDV